MKALKIVGIVLAGVLLLVAVLVALAFTPSIQKWAVKKAVEGQPGTSFDASHLAAGFSAADISDLRYTKEGMVVTAKGISARYSAWDFLRREKLNADSITIDELVIDLRHVTAANGASPGAPQSAPGQPGARPGDPADEPFEGILKQAQLPFDVRVGSLNARGRALLPNEQVVVFELKGAGIETGQRGKLEWVVDFADSTTGAALRGLRSTGTAGIQISADRRINLVEIDAIAAAVGPGLPPDRIQLTAKAEQAAAGNEGYAATIAMLRGNTTEPIFKTNAQFLAQSREITGTWDLSIRTEQLAALLTGLGLPPVAANGAGKFNLKPDTRTIAASGDLQGEAARLEQLSPALAAIGAARFKLTFDGGLAGDTAQLNKLDLAATDGTGRKFADISVAQRVGYELVTKRITFANPNEELARVSVQSLPLAWAQPMVSPRVIESGELSLILAVNAEPDGSRVRVRAIEPVSLRSVSVREGETKLVDQLTLTLRPNIDYTATRITAELADLNISMPTGDSAVGKVTADVTNFATSTSPTIAFSSELKAKIVHALTPYLPVQTGPLTLTSVNEGRLEGDILQLTRASSTVSRDNGALLSSFELQQPVRADLKASTFTVANPDATAIRLRLGEIPLAWAEPFVANSKLDGSLAGGVFEVSMRSVDDLTVTTAEPLMLRSVSATIEGKPLAQNLDLSTTLTATKRGETIIYDVRRFEVKQGENTLAGVSAAGEAKLGEKLLLSAKGNLEANIPALMAQPALAPFATLSRGQVSAAFEANLADAMQAKATLTARNLVAKQDNRALGDLEATLNANMKTDGSGSLVMPLTLTNAQRKSDLNVNATFGKAPNRETFLVTGKVASNNLVIEDFEPLAALAPASETPKAQPKPTRDEKPFWAGVNGKLELDLKRVLYGKDYVISGVRGAATITDSRLSLDGLEGRMNENPFKVAANVNFSAQQPQPYVLAGTANVTNLRIGEILRAANPNEKPAIESQVNVVADLKGNGATVTDLAKNVYGRFDVSGSAGVLRALGRKGEVASGLSTVLGIAGALAGSATTSAIGELTAAFAELKFDSFKMQVERGADLGLKFTNIEFISPLMRTTGNGMLANKPGVPMQEQPMQIQLQFGAKGGLEHLLSRVNALGQEADPQGYRLMQRNFTVGGTPANPDSSSLWSILLREAATRGAPALQDLLNRRK